MIGDMTLKLTEISTEYSAYRIKSQIELADLESKLEQEKLKAAENVQCEELHRQLKELRM